MGTLVYMETNQSRGDNDIKDNQTSLLIQPVKNGVVSIDLTRSQVLTGYRNPVKNARYVHVFMMQNMCVIPSHSNDGSTSE